MDKKELEEFRKLEDIALEFVKEENNELMTMEIKIPKKHLLKVIYFLRSLNNGS